MPVYCRGIRGATTADANTSEEIIAATREMLEIIIAANHLEPDDISSVIFTTTPDLNAEYPAVAARRLGWDDVALMCSHEMAVPNGLKQCIRVLIHWNTSKSQSEVVHIYIKEAQGLRPERNAAASVQA